MSLDFKNWTPPERTAEGCGNRHCRKCHPAPWFTVSTTRVERATYKRRVQAATVEEAATKKPDRYDEEDTDVRSEVLDETVPVVEAFTPTEEFDERYFICWFEQPQHSSRGWRPGDLTSIMGVIRLMKECGQELPPHILRLDEDVPENRERIEQELVEEETLWRRDC